MLSKKGQTDSIIIWLLIIIFLGLLIFAVYRYLLPIFNS